MIMIIILAEFLVEAGPARSASPPIDSYKE